MSNWIPKNKLMRFAATLASLSIILYFVGLFVVLAEIKRVENFYQSAESEASKEEKSWAIKAIAEANKEPIQTLRSFFIQKGDEVKFIEQMEEIAAGSTVKFEISSIDVRANQQDSFKEDVNVKINIEGSWKNIMYFIDKLEKMSFGVSVEKISLDAGEPGNWVGFIELIVFREK